MIDAIIDLFKTSDLYKGIEIVLTIIVGITGYYLDKKTENKYVKPIFFSSVILIGVAALIELFIVHNEKNHGITVEQTKEYKDSLKTSRQLTATLSGFHKTDSLIISSQKHTISRDSSLLALKGQVDYTYWSTLDMLGNRTNGTVTLEGDTNISIRMSKIIYTVNDQSYIRNDKFVLPIINDLISKYPKFPYGYASKYLYLKQNKDKEYKTWGKKALEIFKKTTSIPGHNPAQDILMNKLIADLQDQAIQR
jgi:hypothetical protein